MEISYLPTPPLGQDMTQGQFFFFKQSLSGLEPDFGLAVRVFANGSGDLGSISGRVIPKTLKMELDTTLLNTQHYKVRFKGKVELLHLGVVATEKGAFESPSTMVANFTYF